MQGICNFVHTNIYTCLHNWTHKMERPQQRNIYEPYTFLL